MKFENLDNYAAEAVQGNLANLAARRNQTAVPERERRIYQELFERRRSLFTAVGRLASFSPDYLADGHRPHHEHKGAHKKYPPVMALPAGHQMGRRSAALPVRDVTLQTPIGPVTRKVYVTTTNEYKSNQAKLHNVGDLLGHEPNRVQVNFYLGYPEGSPVARDRRRDVIDRGNATELTAIENDEVQFIQAEQMGRGETYEWGSVSVPQNPETNPGGPAKVVLTHPDRLQSAQEAQLLSTAIRTELDEMQPTAMLLFKGLGADLPEYMRVFTDELDKGPFPFTEAEITSGQMDPSRNYGGARFTS